MSLLGKIISTIRSDHATQARERFPPAMPAANCLTAEVALVDRSVGELEEDDNPTKQRRYYVKSGLTSITKKRFWCHDRRVPKR
jgi:hypothetical protein